MTDRKNSGWMILDSPNRIGFTISHVVFGIKSTTVQAFDLDTLRPIRTATLQGVLPLMGGASVGSGQVTYAVDSVEHKIYLAVSDTDQTGTTGGFGAGDPRQPLTKILAIDEVAFTSGQANWTADIAIPAEDAPRVTAHSLHGMALTRDGDVPHLLLQFGATGSFRKSQNYGAANDHWLLKWNLRTGRSAWPQGHLLTECQGAPLRQGSTALDGAYPLPIAVVGQSILVVCQASPNVAQVLLIPTDANGFPDATKNTRTSLLPRQYIDAFADTEGQRVLVKTVGLGRTWWTLDIETGSWAGAIGVTPGDAAIADGLDRATGRLYTLAPDGTYRGRTATEVVASKGGLLISDSRLTPAPQASIISQELNYPGLYEIQVDPATPTRARRVFIRRGHPLQGNSSVYPGTRLDERVTPVEDHFIVIEDATPVAQRTAAQDVDRFTTDVDESEATGANFTGAASGYGMRSLLVGGIAAATEQSAAQSTQSPCLTNDRELISGQVVSADVTNVLASARAKPLAIDATTRADMEHPRDRCRSNSDKVPPAVNDAIGEGQEEDGDEEAEQQEEAALGDAQVECTGVGDKDLPKSTDPLSSKDAAEVNCDAAKYKVTAGARRVYTGPTMADQDAGVRVQEAWTEVTVERQPGVGMVSRVTSVAKGIEIEEVGTIGLVRVVAETVAGGRPRSAYSSFTRTVCGIEIGGIGGNGCLNDPEAAAALINRGLGNRGRARVPIPDASLRGSPGGYLAAIQKPFTEEFSDTVVNRDLSRAVPGLELIMYRDHVDLGAGRQIIQFAGVTASSTYGIYELSGGGSFLPDNPESGQTLDDAVTEPGSELDRTDGNGVTNPARVGRTSGRAPNLLDRLFGRPLIVRNLVEGLLAAAVWLSLGLPAYLATRRRDFASTFFGRNQ